MTLKVESYPEMNYHQRFPSSSKGLTKNGGSKGHSGNGAVDAVYAGRTYHNAHAQRLSASALRSRQPSAPSSDPHDPHPHSSSFADTRSLMRNGALSSPDHHSSSFPDGLAAHSRTLAHSTPTPAPPAFVSATMSRGLRRADHPPPAHLPRLRHQPSLPYRNGPPSSPQQGAQTQPSPPLINLHRFPSQHHRIQATPPRRVSSSSSPVSNPQQLIWSVSREGNGGNAGGGRATVVLRKPRSRRLLRSLLCCLGAKPHSGGRGGEGNGNGGGDQRDGAGLGGLGPGGPKSEALQGPASPYLPKPNEKLLLPPVRPMDTNKKTLIIDLDETLVHSSFKPVKNADFVIPVEIDGVIHQVYVLKRPYVDEFLDRIGDIFECILFTASLAKYADPVADLLDKRGVFRSRLFREACVFHKGNYVKDLNRLGRDLKKVLIVDNSPASYAFHPDNAIPVQSWFDDMSDTELLDLLPILERMVSVENVYAVLRNANEHA